MARPLRIESPDATYHVTSRGNERRDIFYSDDDRNMFLGFLAQAIQRFGWRLSAWVLMSNHYHLVRTDLGSRIHLEYDPKRGEATRIERRAAFEARLRAELVGRLRSNWSIGKTALSG
jgi:hypothetical protein